MANSAWYIPSSTHCPLSFLITSILGYLFLKYSFLFINEIEYTSENIGSLQSIAWYLDIIYANFYSVGIDLQLQQTHTL